MIALFVCVFEESVFYRTIRSDLEPTFKVESLIKLVDKVHVLRVKIYIHTKLSVDVQLYSQSRKLELLNTLDLHLFLFSFTL